MKIESTAPASPINENSFAALFEESLSRQEMRAGEVIITGSVVPPIAIERDESELAFALDPVGTISVRFE